MTGLAQTFLPEPHEGKLGGAKLLETRKSCTYLNIQRCFKPS
jgi:hypothetical protein